MSVWLKDILAACAVALFVVSTTIVLCSIFGAHP